MNMAPSWSARLSRRSNIANPCLVALVAVVTFLPLTRAYFSSDDFFWLEAARQAASDPTRLITGSMHGWFTPILNLFFLLQYRLFALNPWGYYAVQIAGHAINSILVYYLTHRLTENRTLAFISGIAFATALSHYQAITWISGAVDLVPTVFYLLAMYSFIIFLRTGHRVHYFVCLLWFTLALFAKERVALSLPITLFLITLFWQTMKSTRVKDKFFNYLKLYTPFLLIIAAYFLFRSMLQQEVYFDPATTERLRSLYTLDWRGFPTNIQYLASLVIPGIGSAELARYVPAFVPQSLIHATTQARPTVFLLMIALSVFALAKGAPLVRFCVCWMYVSFLPVTFLASDEALRTSFRYLYVPSIPFVILVSAFLVAAARFVMTWKRPRRRALAMAFLAAMALTYLLANVGAIEFGIAQKVRAGVLRERLIGQVLTQYPIVPKGSAVWFVGLPDIVLDVPTDVKVGFYSEYDVIVENFTTVEQAQSFQPTDRPSNLIVLAYDAGQIKDISEQFK